MREPNLGKYRDLPKVIQIARFREALPQLPISQPRGPPQ